MDRFIEFEQDVSMADLEESLSQNNPGIMLLRYSKLTGTVKVRTEENVGKKEIKKAFSPYKIKHIYDDFPVRGS